MAFAVWVIGLPGSGKSSIAKELGKILERNKVSSKELSMDRIRKKISKKPRYDNKERDTAYKKFAEIGFRNIKQNKNVIFDATAHKREYRDYARKNIENFVEVYIECPIDICIERESKRKKGLVIAEVYKKSLERKKTGKVFKKLGKAIGIDVMFEKPKKAEIKIDSSKIKPKEAAKIILGYLKKNSFV